MTENTMKGDASSSSKIRVELRPPLHRRRCSKSGSGGEELSSDIEQNINTEGNTCISPSMSADENMSTDNHMTMEQINVARGDSKETRQLKELLLVHLDMITQQQEIILAKDRQLRTLKSEKEALKCRLERMERRMTLLRQKGDPVPDNFITETLNLTNSAPPAGRGIDAGHETHGRGHKRKGSLEPQSLSKKFASSFTPSSEGVPASRTVDDTVHHSPRSKVSSTQLTKSAFGQRHFSRTPFKPSSGDAANDSDSTVKTMSPPRRRKQDEPPERGILDDVKERLVPVCDPNDNEPEYFHRTDRMYYVPWEVPLSPLSRISPKKQSDEVSVPSYRIKLIPTGYSMEGTENLDDEIFAKRHQKPELEEKRRKRWDIQRLREQRLYQKLQGKKHKQCTKQHKINSTETPPESFIPIAEDVRYVEVCSNVPVSAFGYPVPHLEESEFELPDFDLDKRERDEVKRSSRKKR